MKLRFEVDQAECFRKGIDCPKSIVTIEVDPAKIPESERILIADRLRGIDVTSLFRYSEDVARTMGRHIPGADGTLQKGVLIVAKEATYPGLIAAVKANQSEVTDGPALLSMANHVMSLAEKQNAKDALKRSKGLPPV